MVTGSVHFTRNQYNFTRTLFGAVENNVSRSISLDEQSKDRRTATPTKLPSYSRVQRVLKPRIEQCLGPRPYDIVYNQSTKQVTREYSEQKETRHFQLKVRIIPVSEYARQDIAFPPFATASAKTDGSMFLHRNQEKLSYLNLTDSTIPGIKSWDCLDDWPLVGNRDEFYGEKTYIYAHRGIDHVTPWKSLHRAYVGDSVSIVVRGIEKTTLEIQNVFGNRTDHRESQNPVLGGIIAAIGTATTIHQRQPNNNAQTANFGSDIATDEREEGEILRTLLRFLEESSSHIVSVDQQCTDSREQLFGAGDVIAIIKRNGNIESRSRLVLVDRFNVPSGEFDQQMFCIQVNEDSTRKNITYHPIDTGHFICDVMNLSVVETDAHTTSHEHAGTKPSKGILSDGRVYYVYRFILFWDGFRIGDNGSRHMEGVYMIPLNLPAQYRCSTSALRILSVLPVGVPGVVAIEELLKDIKKGMSEGFQDYDSHGQPITIFLDFVGCIGDTPAINEVLDVKGHAANACCHICRFHRLQHAEETIKQGSKTIKLLKPRYMGTQCHGGKCYASRSVMVHRTLSEFDLSDATIQRLGIQPNTTNLFSLYSLECNIISTKIQKTEMGEPVLFSSFDSYRSLLIGPDHLIYGLAKNSINAVLSILPSTEYLKSYEKIAITVLGDARTSFQRRLLNLDERCLLSLSITDVFALLNVSEYCFFAAIMSVEGVPPTREQTRVSDTCFSIVQLVGSLSELASRIWFRPRILDDGPHVVQKYNEKYGIPYLRETQEKIESYIRRMNNISSYSKEDLENYRKLLQKRDTISVRKKKLLQKRILEKTKITAILDCPNVHRLLELAHVYLPMVGSSSRISELDFERGHQSLKRAIENSNNHDSQLQAVTSAVFNDWQGRLSMLLTEDPENSEIKRSLFRLLFGREAIACRVGILTEDDEKMVLAAVGGDNIIRNVLAIHGKTVLIAKVANDGVSYWTGVRSSNDALPDLKERGTTPYSYEVKVSTTREICLHNSVNEAMSGGRRLLNSLCRPEDWRLLEKVYPRHHDSSNRKKSLELMPGDIVQCVGIASSNIHPYVIPCSRSPSSYEDNPQILYFYVLFLFEISSSTGAIVLPCCRISQQNGIDNNSFDGSIPRLQIDNLQSWKIENEEKSLKLMTLTEGCTRVFVVHQCTGSCFMSAGKFLHCEHPFQSQFHIQNRENGYPPRAS